MLHRAARCWSCREPHLALVDKESLTNKKGILNKALIQDSTCFTPRCSAVGVF